MHVPFAEKKDELLFGEIRIDERDGYAVEGKIPGGVPGILPLVGHGNDVVVVKMRPILVAAVPTLIGRLRPGGIALQPGMDVIVIKLLGPEHASEGLAHAGLGIGRKIFRIARFVEFVGFLLTRGEERVESGSEVVGAGNVFASFGVTW